MGVTLVMSRTHGLVHSRSPEDHVEASNFGTGTGTRSLRTTGLAGTGRTLTPPRPYPPANLGCTDVEASNFGTGTGTRSLRTTGLAGPRTNLRIHLDRTPVHPRSETAPQYNQTWRRRTSEPVQVRDPSEDRRLHV